MGSSGGLLGREGPLSRVTPIPGGPSPPAAGGRAQSRTVLVSLDPLAACLWALRLSLWLGSEELCWLLMSLGCRRCRRSRRWWGGGSCIMQGSVRSCRCRS